MIAYKFYSRVKGKGDRFIGILPERRESAGRMTQESVIRWVRTVLSDIVDIDFDDIYFIQVEFEDWTQEGLKK
jgi:hypothetical protein